MLKAIHAHEDVEAAKEKVEQVVKKLNKLKLRRASELVSIDVEQTLTYCGFPDQHGGCIKTNISLERILREIRRRTRVVGAFPDGHSALMLSAARLRDIAGTCWDLRRNMNMDLLNIQSERIAQLA